MLLEEMPKTDGRVFWQVILPYRYVALDAVSLRCFWTESETLHLHVLHAKKIIVSSMGSLLLKDYLLRDDMP
jgi:hypothetical protein